jgi:octaprenyl-diphosphate synthase
MDILSEIRKPVEKEFNDFLNLFKKVFNSDDVTLGNVLLHIGNRGGKHMRPLLLILIAKAYGDVNEKTKRAAVGVELLHTASLVHDDVVDESDKRRGQPSVNSLFNNKISVLVGDYLLSSSISSFVDAENWQILRLMTEVCATLSSGEILQIENISNTEVSEETYYEIIYRKTASLFEACAGIGALSVNASEDDIRKAKELGKAIGMTFQIRDDIFDYYDSDAIGKPTGNDMLEGKLTLPVIYAINNSNDGEMTVLVDKVKRGDANKEEIGKLVAYAKENGGIDYAYSKMEEFTAQAKSIVSSIKEKAIRDALTAYIDYVSKRTF